jgi:DNA-binding response OmpR family regulator
MDRTVGLHLLIVEPDRELLATYRAYFERFGITTSTATSGQQAIERFREGSIDKVLLEPVIPDGSHGLLSAMAGHLGQLPLPVVVVSRLARMGLEFPVEGYFVKPVSMSTLLCRLLVSDGSPTASTDSAARLAAR